MTLHGGDFLITATFMDVSSSCDDRLLTVAVVQGLHSAAFNGRAALVRHFFATTTERPRSCGGAWSRSKIFLPTPICERPGCYEPESSAELIAHSAPNANSRILQSG